MTKPNERNAAAAAAALRPRSAASTRTVYASLSTGGNGYSGAAFEGFAVAGVAVSLSSSPQCK